MTSSLHGKKGLVIGHGGAHSLARACARAFSDAGAELALTWRDSDAGVPPQAQPLAAAQAAVRVPLDPSQPRQLEALFDTLRKQWARLDFVLHAVEPNSSHGGSSAEDKGDRMNLECHSFMRAAHLAQGLMRHGGCLLTTRVSGAGSADDDEALRAAIDSGVRYLAHELGPHGVRVNSVVSGPLAATAAARRGAGQLRRAPLRRPVDLEEIGALCVFLVGDSARSITGDALYVDGGYHLVDGVAPCAAC